ncbi:hypothetical protein HCN51_44560 [Nonomuraea sp. FMUSA5-5]|uniref:Type IV secretion system protein n=1 Tax=Nonomuraea composti TaxID=2720023 RepID=A0ABX1BFA1_9ACTN|nr:hypothetical protein [Nonomuraea sp. FMUSA5-5]NJP96429.1 hypothetical protein [Nonomuraea sp. FMUSA5-5]
MTHHPSTASTLSAVMCYLARILMLLAITLPMTATSAAAEPDPPPAPSPTANPRPTPPATSPPALPPVPPTGPMLTPPPHPHPGSGPAVPAAEPTPQPGSGGAEECGWLDFGCKINRALNGWFGSIVTEAIQPAFQTVGTLLLSAPPPDMVERVQELSAHVRVVANTLLALFVLAGGVIVMAYGSVQISTTAAEVAPRVVVAAIALNFSLTVCQYAIELANGLVAALLGDGVDGRRAGDLIANKLANPVGQLAAPQMFFIWMVAIAVVMGLILAFIAVVRIALLLFLMIAAPLALLCHALPQTEHIARLWWRAFTGVLVMQVLQALVLILAFKVYFTDAADAFTTGPDQPVLAAVKPIVMRAIDTLVLIGLLFILIKIPSWVARSVWQPAQPQLLTRLAKALIVYKTLGLAETALTKGGRTARTATRNARPARRPGRPPGTTGKGRPSLAGPRPRGGPQRSHPAGGTPPMNTPNPAAQHGPQQLQLPLNLPATASRPGSQRPGTAVPRGRQLALPFPVTRVPRPPTAPTPAPPTDPWIRPKPPWTQPMLPGMPTRPARPRQLHLRLDPPPGRRRRRDSQ